MSDNTIAKVIFGTHAAVRAPRKHRDSIRKFYRDVLGCKITGETDDKGGQVFRLVGINEDLSKYEGNGVIAAASPEFWSTFDSE